MLKFIGSKKKLKMAKILFLAHKFYPSFGGIETVSELLAGFFASRGHTVRLVTTTEEKGEKAFPYPVIRNPKSLEMIKEFQWADLIFENNPSLHLSWLNVLFRKPHIISLHTWISPIDGVKSFKDKIKFAWLRQADKVIACSTKLKNHTCADAVVIANAYNNDLFKRLANIEKTEDFIFLGRLVSDKGTKMLVKAFDQFLQIQQNKGNHRKYCLTIVGDGHERFELEKMTNDFVLQGSIRFTGVLTETALTEILNRHRYIVVPSLWEEPFGLIVLEGMACGCLPIVSDGGGLPEAVGGAGLTFKRGDVNAMADSMDKIVNDADLERELRSKFADHLKNHQPHLIAEKYLKIIESVLNR